MEIKVGDRIKFRAVTRWSDRAVWRVVNGFDRDTATGTLRPTVRFGWPNFIVRPNEILEVQSN